METIPPKTVQEIKEMLQFLSAKINMLKMRRSVGIYESIKELKQLEDQFHKLSKTYMRMKKREMEKNILNYGK